MKRRILFVDDDPNLLQGLKRMLHSRRDQWEMEFASGGQEALEYLSATPFDAVVSDVRMPVMDGVQLLTEVRQQFPQIVRILLSGQSSSKTIMSAIGPAHQYLAKPCDADTLKNTIERACALGDLLANDRLKEVVGQAESMPACPSLYMRLEEELQKEDTCIEKVAAIISKDVGMTAKILKLVNSAFFGLQKHISDPAQAALFLGIDTLKTLVLGLQVFQQLNPKGCPGFFCERLLDHSLLTANHARKIVRAEGGDQRMSEEAFTAGMLHDVGILLMASHFPDRYQEVLRFAETHGLFLEEAELQMLGTTHAEIGAYLLGLWGLTNTIVEAVAYHHCPTNSLGRGFGPLTAVHIANVLADESGTGASGATPSSLIDIDYLTQVGLANRVPAWSDLLRDPVEA